MMKFTSETRIRVIDTRELFRTRLASSQASGAYYRLMESDGAEEAPTRYGTNAAPYEPLFTMWTERAWIFQVREEWPPQDRGRYYDGPGPLFRGPVEFVRLPGLTDPIPCPAGQVESLKKWYEESITRHGGVYALYDGWCAYAGSDERYWHRLTTVALFAVNRSHSPWDDRDELFTALGKTRAISEETVEGLRIRKMESTPVLQGIVEYGDVGLPDDPGVLDDPNIMALALYWFQGAAEIRRPDGTVIVARGKAIGHNLSQLLVGPGGWLEIHRPDGSVASSDTLDHWTHVQDQTTD